ncbi:MAG: class I SAM-dependent methyltransferase, partial [Planctomycetes bacterium]|nr:class I SAM-dependent methyltransferase [Planctomycetota bacterium]
NSAEGVKVFTLDLPPELSEKTSLEIEENDRRFIEKECSGARFKGLDVEPSITQLYGDSALFDFLPYADSMDVIFVDGSHSYDYVLNDSEAALRMASDNAVVIWHDYTKWSGVTKALNKLYGEGGVYSRLRWVENTSLVVLLPKGFAGFADKGM